MKRFIGFNNKFASGAVMLFMVFLLSNSCQKSDSNNGNGSKGQGANEVYIQNMSFSPGTLTITVGTTVKWTNKDGVTHTVTSDNGLFNSGNIASNGTYTYSFTSTGTFEYHCAIHPSMLGTVKVNPVAGY